MAKPRSSLRGAGFSLIELMVALVFTMILMAGMASVFKASLSSFYTSGESLSSARRNHMSIDLLSDDLNTAGMYLVNLTVPPPVVASNPPFYIVPNVPIPGAGATDPETTDELYFYLDQPLPFEGKLTTAAPQRTAAELVLAGQAQAASDRTFTIDCQEAAYARQVKAGQYFIFKDSWEAAYISSDPQVSGSTITIQGGEEAGAKVTGLGSAGLPAKVKHISGCGVVFVQAAQMVRYRIEMVRLDPQNAAGIPCLVRDQGSFTGSTFTPSLPQQIITENIAGFKVYLSANGGTDWAGYNLTATGFDSGWTSGIKSQLNAQLATAGRPEYRTTDGNDHWFREIPTLVRVDISTRSATQRTEYASVANTVAYNTLTQSLVFVPRHFGLSMQ